MKRTLRRPPSLREKLQESQRGLNFYAAMSGKPPIKIDIPEKRKYTKTSADDSEAPVINAVADLLAIHPQVLFAVRQNSGAMQVEQGGRAMPVWFYKIVRKSNDLTITDFWGFMRDGRPFAFEAKRPSWKGPKEPRELKQREFIYLVESIGGIGGFVRSADDVQRLLA